MAFGGVRQRTRIRPTVSVSGSGTGPAGPNQPPVWQTVADFAFIEGIPNNYSVANKVSDPGGSVASVALNSGTLPAPRLSFNTGTRAYAYTGAAGPLTSTAYTLIATDNLGLTSVSNSHNLSIQAITFATPTPIYDAGVQADYPLSSLIPAFDSAQDVITVDGSGVAIGPGSSHTWLTLAGPGGSLLRASGAQVGTDDFSGLRLRVTRNSGPFAICPSTTVVVNASPTAGDSWTQIDTNNVQDTGITWARGFTSRVSPGRTYWTFQQCLKWDSATGKTTQYAARGTQENFGQAQDLDNNCIWAGTAGPGYAAMHRTLLPVSGSAETIELLTKNSGGIGAALHWHPFLKRLFHFGGYSGESLRSTSTNPFVDGGNFTSFPETGDIPVIGTNPDNASDSTRYTYKRTGMDYRDGGIWIIGDFENLYWGRVVSGTMVWKLLQTTGTKPPTCAQFALHESQNYILGYTGMNGVAQGSGTALLRQTHVLDLDTFQWRLGPTGAGVTPTDVESGYGFLTYDKLAERILGVYLNRTTGWEDVWSFNKDEDTLALTPQVFTARGMVGVELGRSPWEWGFGNEIGKHVIWLNDKKRKRIVSVGGDFRGLWWWVHGAISANVESFAYNAKTDVWTNVSPSSTGPGTVVPCRPNDGQPTVHDTKRDRYWVLPGGWALPSNAGPHLHGSTVNLMDYTQGQDLGGFFYKGKTSVSGATLFNGLMWMNPDTGIWTGVTNSNIGSPNPVESGLIVNSYHAGIYDPHQDCIMSCEGQADVQLYRCFLNDNPALITHSRVTVPLTALGNLIPQAMQLQQPCFDILGRKVYAMLMMWDNTGAVIGQRMIRFDMDNPFAQAELLATPPFQSTSRDPAGTGGSFRILFDTKNRRVLYPVQQSPEGIVVGMASYNPVDNSWTTHQLTVSPSSSFGPPVGNSMIFDETHNCIVMGGSGGEVFEEQGYFYLWRFA